jgi:hypothetical protein
VVRGARPLAMILGIHRYKIGVGGLGSTPSVRDSPLEVKFCFFWLGAVEVGKSFRSVESVLVHA